MSLGSTVYTFNSRSATSPVHGNKPSPSTQTTTVALKPNNPPPTLMPIKKQKLIVDGIDENLLNCIS
jgi:hypothetical protein